MALFPACSDKIEQSEHSIKIYQSMGKTHFCASLENVNLFVSSVTNILFHIMNPSVAELV